MRKYWLVLAVALLASHARAAGPDAGRAGPATPPDPTVSLRGELYGGYGLTRYSAAIPLGIDLLVRYRVAEGGADCNALLAAANAGTCAAVLGGALRLGRFGFDLLGAVGRRHWAGVGSHGFINFDGNPGGSARLWAVGVHGGASVFFGAFTLGLWASFDDDLRREHVVYTYRHAGWFGAPDQLLTGEADVGGPTFFVALRLGVQADL